MLLAALAIVLGLALLVWSADRFVDSATALARILGIPTLVVGMVVIGFGTSAPEIAVSVFGALDGSPGIALGNAYGSNIANIGLILGLTALLSPVTVRSRVLRRELPILAAVTALAAWQLLDGQVSRLDALGLLGLFSLVLLWSLRQSAAPHEPDALEDEVDQCRPGGTGSLTRTGLLVLGSLVLLVVSSRALVWGAETIARALGVSDLVIGLTIVAVGTSLPELASSIAAARSGGHDLAVGNIIGSNIFNPLGVVGISAFIEPMDVDPFLLARDVPVMAGFTVALFLMGMGLGGPGRINRLEGLILLAAYAAYTIALAREATALQP